MRSIAKTILKELGVGLDQGFRPKGSTLTKELPDGIFLLIEVQKSRYSDPGSFEFTLNLGACVPAANVLLWGKWANKISTPLAQIRVRIGRLLPAQEDLWWEIHNEDEIRQFFLKNGADIIAAINRFFSKLDGRKGVIEYLEKRVFGRDPFYEDALHLCALKTVFGDKRKFRMALTAFRKIARREGMLDSEIREVEIKFCT